MRRPVIYLIIIITVLFGACGRKPRYVIDEDKMANVLYDIQLAQAIYRSNTDFSTDEKKDALLNGILKKYNITQAELDSSLLWYSDNIEIYNTINDSVASRLRANSNALMAVRNMASSGNFSNYLIPPFYYLSDRKPTLLFNIDSLRLKTVDLPKFSLSFDVQGINSLQTVEAGIFFTYTDTLVKIIVPVMENTHYAIAKPELADSLLKNISGYVHLDNKVKGISPDVILYNISYNDSITASTLPPDIQIKDASLSEQNAADNEKQDVATSSVF
ncbi:DUF4296 domain-containing protein [Prevotella sp. 10(H)]|uniref:DUF4296 domain-containing protein n=1 Tax=Prevotella sp. 10(H) TaxID=1158294 RepID=UPI000B22F6EA|nr:DUF4296 domain-containing protein [Prevotella sp. 10(H)]